MNAESLWQSALDILQNEINPNSFNQMFKNIKPKSITEDSLIILIENSFHKDAIEKRFFDHISNAVNEVSETKLKLEIVGIASKKVKLKNDARSFDLHRFTFDNFIVGSSNELAYAASKQICDYEVGDFNPLYIYSDVGLGKTHLLLSIHRNLTLKNVNSIYTSSERFTNEYILAIKERKTDEFRKRYRNCEALLIDDIQFLGGKTQTQEGFFHTFNELFLSNKKIIIAGDDPMKLVDLESRLVSRFQSGLVVDIQAPDYETKVAIIEHKASSFNLNLNEEIIDYVANLCQVNIRQIESIINRLKAMSSLTNQTISLENAKSMIIGFDEIKLNNKPEPALVLPAVAAATGVSEDEIKSNSRSEKIVNARRLSCFVLNKDLNLTTTASGSILNKNHSSVINGVKFVEKKLKSDFDLRHCLQQIRNTLKIN
ncbi:MAG: chromosomal replication initiator protein DnaA [Dehalococcoidia bacterium]|nr:chromosomal replication initiator protein DnaA [Dehalococcoidia bacterium]|tara:strand:- start:202 stop:1488 length:1287 start_codon:yes stop_codon:yes gene_type:complete